MPGSISILLLNQMKLFRNLGPITFSSETPHFQLFSAEPSTFILQPKDNQIQTQNIEVIIKFYESISTQPFLKLYCQENKPSSFLLSQVQQFIFEKNNNLISFCQILLQASSTIIKISKLIQNSIGQLTRSNFYNIRGKIVCIYLPLFENKQKIELKEVLITFLESIKNQKDVSQRLLIKKINKCKSVQEIQQETKYFMNIYSITKSNSKVIQDLQKITKKNCNINPKQKRNYNLFNLHQKSNSKPKNIGDFLGRSTTKNSCQSSHRKNSSAVHLDISSIKRRIRPVSSLHSSLKNSLRVNQKSASVSMYKNSTFFNNTTSSVFKKTTENIKNPSSSSQINLISNVSEVDQKNFLKQLKKKKHQKHQKQEVFYCKKKSKIQKQNQNKNKSKKNNLSKKLEEQHPICLSKQNKQQKDQKQSKKSKQASTLKKQNKIDYFKGCESIDFETQKSQVCKNMEKEIQINSKLLKPKSQAPHLVKKVKREMIEKINFNKSCQDQIQNVTILQSHNENQQIQHNFNFGKSSNQSTQRIVKFPTKKQQNLIELAAERQDLNYIAFAVVRTTQHLKQFDKICWQLPMFLFYREFYSRRVKLLEKFKSYNVRHQSGDSEKMEIQIQKQNQDILKALKRMLNLAVKKYQKKSNKQIKQIMYLMNTNISIDCSKVLTQSFEQYLKSIKELKNKQQKDLTLHQIEVMDAFLIIKGQKINHKNRIKVQKYQQGREQYSKVQMEMVCAYL